MEAMSDSMDLMEQKVHELDARLKQMKEERDQVILENDELQVGISWKEIMLLNAM